MKMLVRTIALRQKDLLMIEMICERTGENKAQVVRAAVRLLHRRTTDSLELVRSSKEGV